MKKAIYRKRGFSLQRQKKIAALQVFCIKPLFLILTVLALTACSALPKNIPEYQNTSAPPQETQIIAAAPTKTPLPEAEENTPKILRIWLPPSFDPEAERNAGEILQARLENFQKRRPDLRIEVRIKSLEGEAGLLNALLAARHAAPSAMPDLIALPRSDFEKAAEAGVLHPLDGLTTILDDPDWFPYARPLAQIKNSTYGLPFSANLLGMLYPAKENASFPTLETLRKEKTQILLPEEKTLLGFCLYGNTLYAEDGTPNLDAASLLKLLNFYQSDFVTEEKSENALPVLWTDDFLKNMPQDMRLVPIPAPEGNACSLADAWLWALAGSTPDLQPAAVELAEYLTDSDFLAQWTEALGSLPARPTALNENETSLQKLSLLAQPIPDNNTLEFIGNIFDIATNAILTEGIPPETAVQEALAEQQ